MKRFFTVSMLAVAAMAAFSCKQEIVIDEASAPARTPKVVTAYTDADITPDTKTSLDGTTVLWSSTDVVKAYSLDGDTVSSTSTVVSEGGKKAEFTFADLDASDEVYMYAYPAAAVTAMDGNGNVVTASIPTEQTAVAGGFADGANLAVAEGDTNPIFRNVGGFVSFKIKNDDIVSIKLIADDYLTGGTAEVTVDKDPLAVVEGGSKEVCINAALTAPLANGTTYYAVVYPGTFSGLQLVFTDASGRTATYTNPNTLTVGRNANLVVWDAAIPDGKWVGLEDKVFFEERFSTCNGNAGWSGNGVAAADFKSDNDGWTVERANAGDGAAKFGTASAKGSATTPAITISPDDYLTADIKLSFKAGAWNGGSESTTLKVSAEGATLKNNAGEDVSSVDIVKGDWTEYILNLTSITGAIKITFEGQSASSSRFFLDDVCVYYGAQPKVKADPMLSYATTSYEALVGGTLDTPVLSYASGFTGTITYAIGANDDPEVANVDAATGAVTIGNKAGTVTVTASFAGDDTYKASSASYTIKVTSSSGEEWVETAISSLGDNDVFVIVGNNGKDYAMSNDKGTSDPPVAIEVTVLSNKITSTVTDNIKWSISGNANDGYTFHPNGDTAKWLYCTNTNNGVRVGVNNNKTFIISEGYLNHVGTGRFVGIYNSSDWRCYSSSSTNIGGQTFKFYKKAGGTTVTKQDPGMSWSAPTATATITNTGVTFTAPVLTPGHATGITYDSTNKTVATISDAGVVSVLAAGETTIKAIFAGDDTYEASTVSYVLTVTDETVAVPSTIAEIIAAIPASATGSNTAVEFTANLTSSAVVSYVNGKNAYIQDETGAILLFLDGHGLTAGNTISGELSIKAYWYSGIPEMVAIGNKYVKGTGTVPTPKEITLSDLLANYDANLLRLVVLKGVTVTDAIADGDRDGEISQGNDKIAVRAQLNNKGLVLTENETGDLVTIPAIFNSNKQVHFWDNSWFTKAASNKQDPGMSWSAPTATATITNTGVTFTAPVLTPGHATGITYDSTNKTVATISDAGVVSVLAAGETTIKAIFAGDATYKPVTVSYVLTIVDNRTPAGVVVLSEEFDNNTNTDSTSTFDSSTFPNFSGETSKAYTSQYGGVKLGSSSAAGFITSKSLDLSKRFTVTLNVLKYGSDTGKVQVTVGSVTKEITPTSIDTQYSLVFDAATSNSTVKIGTSTKRAYIDNVIITRHD